MKVLFISMDTVRATRLSTLGSTEVATPNLDRLAGEGTVFTKAFATDIPTQPSHTALFTGRYGINTRIVSHFHPPATLDVEQTWLPSLLNDAGCRTGAVDHLFAMKEWFIRGYEDYMVPPGRSRAPASVVNDLALPWLDQWSKHDFFLFLHFWDAHIPYVPPSPFLEQYTGASAKWRDPDIDQKLKSRPSYPLFKRNLYDFLDDVPNLEYVKDLHLAEIAYLDWEIGRLFERLESLGVLDDTLVVIFGDHGENMTEHDAWFDHAGLYDAVTHVPLIIRAPGRMPVARVDDFVALVDVLPTVLDLLDLELPPGTTLDGRSLLPLARGKTSGHRDAIFLSESTWQAKRAVRTSEWKLIRCYDPGIYDRDRTELYDLGQDPDEQLDVADDRPEIVEALGAQLDEWLAEQLGSRPDPMIEVIEHGLPAVRRLAGVIKEDEELQALSAVELDSEQGVGGAQGAAPVESDHGVRRSADALHG